MANVPEFRGVGLGGTTPLTVALPTAVVQDGRSTVTMADPAPAGPSGTPVYAWTWLQQPGSATFSSTSVAQPTVTPDASGEWVALCTVTLAGQTAYFVHTVYVGRVVWSGDWTQESTLDIKSVGVGPHTIFGESWTATNPTAATTNGIINGTGYRITADAVTGNPTLHIGAATLYPAISDAKKYAWLHLVTISGALWDYAGATAEILNSASSYLINLSTGYFSWGQVDYVLGANTAHPAKTVNGQRLICVEMDGSSGRARSDAASAYADPRTLTESFETPQAAAGTGDRTTDLLRLGANFNNSGSGLIVTFEKSWLVEME
jgi:hypothetical protein